MKKFIVKSHIDEARIEYPEDCERIKQVLAYYDLDASLEQCQDLWERYSDTYCAGWLAGLDTMTYEEIYRCVQEFIWPLD